MITQQSDSTIFRSVCMNCIFLLATLWRNSTYSFPALDCFVQLFSWSTCHPLFSYFVNDVIHSQLFFFYILVHHCCGNNTQHQFPHSSTSSAAFRVSKIAKRNKIQCMWLRHAVAELISTELRIHDMSWFSGCIPY